MSYLTLLPEITATSAAYLTVRELLSLFESVLFFHQAYWNNQRFWTTLFSLKVSSFIPKGDDSSISCERVNAIRSSYLLIFESEAAFLSTNHTGYIITYLDLIGKFNSKSLIEYFFSSLVDCCVWSEYDSIEKDSRTEAHFRLAKAGIRYNHLDLFYESMNHNVTCFEELMFLAVRYNQLDIFNLLVEKNKGLPYNVESLLYNVINGRCTNNENGNTQENLFHTILSTITITSTTIHKILRGAIEIYDTCLFDKYKHRIIELTDQQYISLLIISLQSKKESNMTKGIYFVEEILKVQDHFPSLDFHITNMRIRYEDISFFRSEIKARRFDKPFGWFYAPSLEIMTYFLTDPNFSGERQTIIDEYMNAIIGDAIRSGDVKSQIPFLKYVASIGTPNFQKYYKEYNDYIFVSGHQISSANERNRRTKRIYWQCFDIMRGPSSF